MRCVVEIFGLNLLSVFGNYVREVLCSRSTGGHHILGVISDLKHSTLGLWELSPTNIWGKMF